MDFFSKLWQKCKFQYFYQVLGHTIATHPQIKMLFPFFILDELEIWKHGYRPTTFFYMGVIGVFYSGFLSLFYVKKISEHPLNINKYDIKVPT